MKTVEPDPLGAPARDYLAAYRAAYPRDAAARRRANHAAVLARLDTDDDASDDDASDDDDAFADERRTAAASGQPLRRLAISAGLSLAIAASVLLLLRGAVQWATATRSEATPQAMEAVDRAQAEPSQGAATPRTPTPRRATEVGDDTAVVPMPPEVAPPPPPAEASPRPAATAPSKAALDDETRRLAEARAALQADDPKGALAELRSLDAEMPDGALMEERMFYEAVARCRIDATDRTGADAFVARFPQSPHRPHVSAACDGAK